MKVIVALMSLSFAACAPWLVDKPQHVADSRVSVCKKTGSRITRPCESAGSISQQEWDSVKANAAKPPPPTISERRGRKPQP
jgi:hypothetical protein